MTVMATGNNQSGHGDLNLRLLGTVFAFSAILIFVLIVLTQALYLWQREVIRERQQEQVVHRERVQLEQQQRARLNEIRVVDAEADRVSIPIDRAFEKVVEDYRRDDSTDEDG